MINQINNNKSRKRYSDFKKLRERELRKREFEKLKREGGTTEGIDKKKIKIILKTYSKDDNLRIYKDIEINKAIKKFITTDIKVPIKVQKNRKIPNEVTEFYYIVNITFIFRILLFQIIIASLPNNPFLAIILLGVVEIIYSIVNLIIFLKHKNCLFFITVLARILESLIVLSLLFLFYIIWLDTYKKNIELQNLCVYLIFSGVVLEYGLFIILGIYFGGKWVIGKCCAKNIKKKRRSIIGNKEEEMRGRIRV